jgi:hypothetical protein
MSAVLEAIGTALTGVVSWFSTVLGAIETALATSIILQLALAITAVFVGFKILKKVISVVKGLMAK